MAVKIGKEVIVSRACRMLWDERLGLSTPEADMPFPVVSRRGR